MSRSNWILAKYMYIFFISHVRLSLETDNAYKLLKFQQVIILFFNLFAANMDTIVSQVKNGMNYVLSYAHRRGSRSIYYSNVDKVILHILCRLQNNFGLYTENINLSVPFFAFIPSVILSFNVFINFMPL